MANENGTWIMRGLSWDNPYRIRTWQELINWINEIGFLPLFSNKVEGFSAEEHVSPDFWWTGDRQEDPWEWREIISASHQVAYGKFFANNLGGDHSDEIPQITPMKYRKSLRRNTANHSDEIPQITPTKYRKSLELRRQVG